MACRMICAACLLSLALSSVQVVAATVEFTPSVSQVLNKDFTPVDSSFLLANQRLRPRDEPYLLQVDVRLHLSNLGNMVGFASSAFDAHVLGDGQAYSDTSLGIHAWTPDNVQFDSNGPAPGGLATKWVVNRDGGVDPNDLLQIELESVTRDFGPAGIDIRRTIGQHPENEGVGTFYIELPGVPGSTTQASIETPYPVALYDANGETHTEGHTLIGGASATYSVVPEPSGMVLLFIGGGGSAWIQRRLIRRRI